MSEKKTPAIRIQGFMDEWEQNRLSDYLETSKEINISGEYSKKDVLSVSGDYGIVNQIKFQGRSFAGASVLNYGVVNTDDIVYTKSPLKANPYGIIKANKGNPGIVSTLYAVYHPKDKVDAKFVECYFDDNWRLNNYLHPLVNKGAKNDMKVSADNALNGNVIFPSTKDEQVKISNLFTKIECLITLHQRKLTKLQLLKKSMLTKMFPKDGAQVPEIRFRGFHENWGKLLFNDTVNISNDMVDPKKGSFDKLIHIGPGDIEPHTGQLLPGIKTVSESHLISGKFRFYKGDIIYSKIRPELSKCVIAPTDGLASADAYILHCNKEMWQDFLYCILQTKHFYKYATSISMRTGMPKINREELGRYSFLAPSVKEQQLIGAFFTGLNHLISIHQRKLSKLQQIKQAMLSKLFV